MLIYMIAGIIINLYHYNPEIPIFFFRNSSPVFHFSFPFNFFLGSEGRDMNITKTLNHVVMRYAGAEATKTPAIPSLYILLS